MKNKRARVSKVVELQSCAPYLFIYLFFYECRAHNNKGGLEREKQIDGLSSHSVVRYSSKKKLFPNERTNERADERRVTVI